MKEFMKPEADIQKFVVEDIITTSTEPTEDPNYSGSGGRD